MIPLSDTANRVMFADSMDLQIDSSKMVDTKDGLLVKDAIICRAMVLDYNGKKILKSPETLADSMPTMQRMMITDEHPRSRVIMDVSEIKGRVLPETVTLNNNVASGDLLITDKTLADEIRKGKRDLSPGYYADIIEEPGTFNDEPYQAVQKKVLYDHLAVVKAGRCSRPKCGILDSAVSDLQEGDLDMIQDEATLIGNMAAYKAMMTSMMAEMERMMSELPEDLKTKMLEIHDKIKSTMSTMDSKISDSNSSITDEIKAKETKETMAESIVVDGVGYTPEMVKKLVADSAALTEAQKLANETKKLIDAKETALVDQGKALATSEARIATLQATIDTAEQEKRAPLIKQIMDAMPTLKIEDFKEWDFKRLTDTAASTLEAAKLKARTDGKPVKSIIDDAYAKVGEK